MRNLENLASRFLRARKLRGALTALGVAIGVALIVAITVLGASLQASITDQLRQGMGTYDLMAGYQENRLMQPAEQVRVQQAQGVRYAVGVLWLSTHQPQTEGVGMPFNYIGMGEFPDHEFAFPLREGRLPGPGEFVAEPRIVENLGLKVGDTLELPFRLGTQRVTLSGITRSTGKASSDSLMMNLSWLQQQMKLEGQVTLQLVGLKQSARKARVGDELKAVLPDLDVQLRTEFDEVMRNMGGLKPMAIAFGIAGLFAAMFLVAGSFHTAVHERTRELALLRAVGATADQVTGLVLREAALLGAVGAALGLALGAGGATGALDATAASLGVAAHPPVLPWLPLSLEWAGGVLLAVAAAWSPARAAGRVAPLQAMRPDQAREARLEKAGSIAGMVVMAVGAGVVALALLLKEGTGFRALVGTVGGLSIVAGLIMALPRILPGVVQFLARPLEALLPAEAALAGRAVQRHRKRSALTVATLVLGVMLLTSVTTIFGIVDSSSERWVRQQFPADAQVETASMGGLGFGLAEQIAAVPGVQATASQGGRLHGSLVGYDPSNADPRWLAAQAKKRDGSYDPVTHVTLIPIDLAAFSRLYDLGRVQGNLNSGGLTITAEEADQRGLRIGDALTVQLNRFSPAVAVRGLSAEPITYTVTAIVERLPFWFPAFAADRSLFPTEPDNMVFIRYDTARRAEVKAAVRAILKQPGLGMASLRDLHDAMMESRQAMNQQWAILGAVAAVFMTIGLFGLVNSVVTAVHERKRELATLRAIGSTPGQTRRQVMLEMGLLGLAGSLLGLAAGAIFTVAALVALEFPQEMQPPYWLYASCLAAGPVMAAIASVLPATRVSRSPVSAVLQTE